MSEDTRSEDELKVYGRGLSNGLISCIRCWWLFESWPEFFEHYRESHTIACDEAMVEVEKYIDE